jgi:hypothetical protein
MDFLRTRGLRPESQAAGARLLYKTNKYMHGRMDDIDGHGERGCVPNSIDSLVLRPALPAPAFSFMIEFSSGSYG